MCIALLKIPPFAILYNDFGLNTQLTCEVFFTDIHKRWFLHLRRHSSLCLRSLGITTIFKKKTISQKESWSTFIVYTIVVHPISQGITNCFGIILGYFGMKSKLTYKLLPKQVFFPQLKFIHNKFSSQNIVISSQNNVPKYRVKGHEHVFNKRKM